MHQPVLLKEVIILLNIQPGDTILDGTVGGGGHLEKICQTVGEKGVVVGLDQDNTALEKIKNRQLPCERYLINENFRNLDKVLDELKIPKVDKIIFDLGLSSDQLDKSERGFSFQKNEPLLMTFKDKLTDSDLTAKEIVNNWDESNLADIIFGYGGEKFAREIAKQICEARKNKSIETTYNLIEIIKKAVPQWRQHKKIHFATKTFQVLRIVVNDEMGALKDGLQKGFSRLNPRGRLAVISFHSIEDRIVKNFFKEKEKIGAGKIVTKKPMVPTDGERQKNPRSRSAKLRVIEKV